MPTRAHAHATHVYIICAGAEAYQKPDKAADPKKKKKKKKKKNRFFGSNIHGTLLTISVNIHCEPGRLLLRPYIVAAITGATPENEDASFRLKPCGSDQKNLDQNSTMPTMERTVIDKLVF